jgi:hypothetical protein
MILFDDIPSRNIHDKIIKIDVLITQVTHIRA